MEWTEVLVRLTVAAAAAGLIGLERELKGQPAGLRTHAIVSIGAALFTIGGGYGFGELDAPDNPSRVAAQVASGIGFLGAGVILRHGLDVRGLTTAATLWLAAALGVAAGAGMEAAVFITTALVVLVLLSARLTHSLVERRLRRVLRVRYEVGKGTLGRLVQLLEDRSHYVGRMRVVDEEDTEPPQRTVWLECDVPARNVEDLLTDVRDLGAVLDVTIDRAVFEAE